MERNSFSSKVSENGRTGPATEAIYRVEEAHCWINAARAYGQAAVAACESYRLVDENSERVEITR